MKYLFCFAIALLIIPQVSFGQIIDQIKDASDDHSSSSNDNSSSSDDNSSTTYDDSDDDYYYYDDQPDYGQSSSFGYYDDGSYWIDTKRLDSNYKFSAFNILYRRSTSSDKVAVSTPEIQFKHAWFYGSLRINTLIEERTKDEDRYQTVDVQFFGFQTNPREAFCLNLSMGVMSEEYSGNAYFETVAGLRLQPNPAFAIAWEGRLAINEGVSVRTEGNISIQISLVRQKDFSVTANIFGMSSLYYQKVPVKGWGFGAGVRF
jgi:hypothetical protein